MRKSALILALSLVCLAKASAATYPGPSSAGLSQLRNEELLDQYFRLETERLEKRCLSKGQTLEAWKAERDQLRSQLREMLGLNPMPPRTELRPVITGKLEEADFTVEKLHFQASPGLYVTANLYRPRQISQPVPAILYVCGHGRVFTNGVSCGNKTAYHHHGVWFARNGYVALLIDTVQLGEIEGVHHGTYRLGQWWWNSRGYTPAGVEAWFGIRALDYLCTRPEVDTNRIGMTGRSGGGSYTWTVAALDDRVKVAAPVAGITDMRNQVMDGVIGGHCDCMFFLNTFRWDFPTLAALVAPRPLLIANSDKDTIFPLDGVVRLHDRVRRIYQLYGQSTNLGLLITEGPHADTQDLQVPVFRWFNRFLKQEKGFIEMAAKPVLGPEQLRVFRELPADELNTKVQESFVPTNQFQAGRSLPRDEAIGLLREKVFAGWPEEPAGFEPTTHARSIEEGLVFEAYSVDPQPAVQLWLFVLRDTKVKKPRTVTLEILDPSSWTNSPARHVWLAGGTPEAVASLRRQMQEHQTALAYFAPRLVEPSRWMTNSNKFLHLRRRYMLLGQTLDGMRVWDIRCAVQLLPHLSGFSSLPVHLRAQGPMGVNAAYAALFEPQVKRVELVNLPPSHRVEPDYLNVLKVWDIPQMLGVLRSSAQVELR
jgi:dienelactone hydrolase